MPRIAPTLYDFVEADDGEYLKVAEAVLRIFDRQDWLRVNRARARIKVLVDKIGIDEFREHGRGGARRATGSPSATSTPTPLLFVHDEEANAPGRRRRRTRSPNGDRSRVRALPSPPTSQPQRQEGFSTVAGQGHPRRPHARAVPRPRRRSCATSRGGYARTTVHQNLVLRWVRDEAVYDVWQRLLASSASATPAPTRSPTSSAAPAPTAASSASRARWASTRAVQERVEAMDDRRPADQAASTSR